MTEPAIFRSDIGDRARYTAHIEGIDDKAVLTLTKRAPDLIVADHTGVPPSMGGRGVGTALVRRLIADARAAGQRIVPNCPFVHAYAEKHREELAGVIAWPEPE